MAESEKGITILISSHILEELYKVADTFGIINQGELILELSKEELEKGAAITSRYRRKMSRRPVLYWKHWESTNTR